MAVGGWGCWVEALDGSWKWGLGMGVEGWGLRVDGWALGWGLGWKMKVGGCVGVAAKIGVWGEGVVGVGVYW